MMNLRRFNTKQSLDKMKVWKEEKFKKRKEDGLSEACVTLNISPNEKKAAEHHWSDEWKYKKT